jgi:hypothetical protein
MEQVCFPFSRDVPLKKLVADALVEIERLGYSEGSRKRYRATWGQLIEFAGRQGLGDEFSSELMARFLGESRVAGEELGPGEGWRRHAAWGLKVLADYAILLLAYRRNRFTRDGAGGTNRSFRSLA